MIHHVFQRQGSFWGTDTGSHLSVLGWGSGPVGVELNGKAEKGGENGLSMGAWEVEEYEGGITAPAQQPDGQQMTFVLPHTLQAEVGRGVKAERKRRVEG